tara:strand:- start:1267 stop:1491 length:225 start_codon:yes stop_codon:yes gene_type:complete
MFKRKKSRKEINMGLQVNLIAAAKIMESNKFKDESLEGLMLQVSLLRQMIDTFKQTEESLTKKLGKVVNSELIN